MSQQMMNLQGVRVYVPENRLEDARDALREAEEQGRILAENDVPEAEDTHTEPTEQEP